MSDEIKWDSHFCIAVDYDNTLTDQPWDGDLIMSRVQDIIHLQERGVMIVLWTCRFGKRLEEALDKLKSVGFVPNYVNEYPLRESGNKVNVDMYIDDRNGGGLMWDKSIMLATDRIGSECDVLRQ